MAAVTLALLIGDIFARNVGKFRAEALGRVRQAQKHLARLLVLAATRLIDMDNDGKPELITSKLDSFLAVTPEQVQAAFGPGSTEPGCSDPSNSSCARLSMIVASASA